jgi:recombination protein RecR
MKKIFSELTDIISTFPGFGNKSATRIAFFLLKQNDSFINSFVDKLTEFHKNIELCPVCGVLKDKSFQCSLCSESRDNSTIMVVEQPSDAYSIENSGDYHGLYHVLMGVLSPLDGITPSDIRINELRERLNRHNIVNEIIIATNPSIEGNATANYIAEEFKNYTQIKISRIAMGLAIGSQIEYTDSKIISQSIKNRTPISFF